MSIGEDRVRTKFNPSATGLVDQIKQDSARLIDQCQEMGASDGDALRCAHWAAHYYEVAAMWAVKAATAGK